MIQPLVTVAIASYNNAPYLKRCFDSVLNQSYKNIEILVVDDGSKDDTREICLPYYTNKRIRFFFKENGGLSSSRQLAMDNAKGEFIQFIDADDYLNPTCIEKMLNKLRGDESDICICSTVFQNPNGIYLSELSKTFAIKDSDGPLFSKNDRIADIKNPLWHTLLLSDSWNKLYRLDSLKKTGVTFHMPKGLNGTDSMFNKTLALHELKYSCVSMEGYVHVIYQQSAVHRKNRNLEESHNIIVGELIKECAKLGILEIMRKRIAVEYYTFLMRSYEDVVHNPEDLTSKLRELKSCYLRHKQFVLSNNIDTSSFLEMPSKSLGLFYFINKRLPFLLPIYYLIF